DPIRGAHAFYAGSFREWWAPLRPGTRVARRNALVGVHDKKSEFADRAVHEWTAEVFAVSDGPVLSAQYRLMIRTDREKATDWKGDDAWLWKLDCEFRKFNYVGDAHWMRGRVARKYLADGDRPAVDCEIWGENQRGETTTPGHATILLPSRERRDVRLPDVG